MSDHFYSLEQLVVMFAWHKPLMMKTQTMRALIALQSEENQ